MREIKFRVWSKKEQKMFYSQYEGFSFEHNDFHLCHFIPVGYNGEYNIDNYVIMQYTGLKDKNGKEIYERDIIEHCNERYIVQEFIPLSRFYYALNIDKTREDSDDWISMSNVDWEVVGNIYENPELLKMKF